MLRCSCDGIGADEPQRRGRGHLPGRSTCWMPSAASVKELLGLPVDSQRRGRIAARGMRATQSQNIVPSWPAVDAPWPRRDHVDSCVDCPKLGSHVRLDRRSVSAMHTIVESSLATAPSRHVGCLTVRSSCATYSAGIQTADGYVERSVDAACQVVTAASLVI